MLTVVTGASCSGKSTYVLEHAAPGDIVIDFDVIAGALGSPVSHGHSPAVLAVSRAAWQSAVQAAITRHRYGDRVWIVDTAPPSSRRQRYHIAGAVFVQLTAPAAELARRAEARSALCRARRKPQVRRSTAATAVTPR